MANSNPTRRNGPNKKFDVRPATTRVICDLSTLDAKNILETMEPGDQITITRVK